MDTHVLLWQWQGDSRLGPRAAGLIQEALPQEQASVSAISFWELAMRIQKGQMRFDRDIYEWRDSLLRQGLVEIPLNGQVAARAGLLSDMHGDPADRIIVATAQAGHRLLTADDRILRWGGALDCVDARE